MDEAKRADAMARRAKAHADRRRAEERETLEPALSAIEAAGTPYRLLRSGDEPGWMPAWIPAGYGSIPWDRLSPSLSRIFSGYAGDAAERLETVRAAILARAAPGETLRVMAGRLGMSLLLARDDAVRHLAPLLETDAFELWIARPGGPWLIEAGRTHIHVGDAARIGPPRRQ